MTFWILQIRIMVKTRTQIAEEAMLEGEIAAFKADIDKIEKQITSLQYEKSAKQYLLQIYQLLLNTASRQEAGV